ncbi:unnamed protein product [Kuraishia capsulata CBS 1993]|uniref:4-hydroxyphenylpyruvate dioxygenase n=1 Tax=Kuraishia capsulata CBS 1993 TaxID=1382522 RepID=W6MLJ9_9ASCO|nr:uncharacterized protein KUCA_T00003344001 [Kuraishia capsulata CBS 1993]CDK27366.1 unnamed protein product [Kuraishia capsulata CBS 1993]
MPIETQPSDLDKDFESFVNETMHLTKEGIAGTDILSQRDPSAPEFLCFDHLTMYVGCVSTTASFFINQLGFVPYCYKSLETGSRDVMGKVLVNGDIAIQLLSPLREASEVGGKVSDLLDEIHDHLKKHGDGIKDIALRVSDCAAAYDYAARNGAKLLSGVEEYRDENGRIFKVAKVGTACDVVHTFIQRDQGFHGFLPGYIFYEEGQYPMPETGAPLVNLVKIDHCVQNHDWDKMLETCEFYRRAFGFHQFWSVDEKQISTEYSSLRSIVMTSANDEVKIPINEPAKGLCKSQIEEFLIFNSGPGVQHIAFLVDDIVSVVKAMRARGVTFVSISDAYYDSLAKRLANASVHVQEPFDAIKKLRLLVDYDEHGYLLQIFTKPLFDRPTVFFEIIQRHNHNGFGAGNFKSLFEALEADQSARGNLN